MDLVCLTGESGQTEQLRAALEECSTMIKERWYILRNRRATFLGTDASAEYGNHELNQVLDASCIETADERDFQGRIFPDRDHKHPSGSIDGCK